jgi:hypothetical protein
LDWLVLAKGYPDVVTVDGAFWTTLRESPLYCHNDGELLATDGLIAPMTIIVARPHKTDATQLTHGGYLGAIGYLFPSSESDPVASRTHC